MNCIIGDALPAGAVRRFGSNRMPIPVTNDSVMVVGDEGNTLLLRGRGWLAAYEKSQLVAVLRENCSAAVQSRCGVAFLSLKLDGEATHTLVRWSLTTGALTRVCELPAGASSLGTNADASRIAVVAQQRVRLLDGAGALLWEREVEEPQSNSMVVENDAVTLFRHQTDDDYPEEYERVRVTRAAPIERESTGTHPSWYPRNTSTRRQYTRIGLGELAISRDGTRVASARELWTREGVSIPIPELLDSSESSSWGGEYQVYSLAFDAAGELLRISGRNANRLLEGFTTNRRDWLDSTTLLIPWSDRLITERNGEIVVGDRVLARVAQRPRVNRSFDGSTIAVNIGTQVSLFDGFGAPLGTIDAPSESLAVVAPQGRAVACWSGGGFVILFADGSPSLELKFTQVPPAFSLDGSLVAHVSDWFLRVTDLKTRKMRQGPQLTSPIVGLMFGPDGNLFTACSDGRVLEWAELIRP
ncbi:MAG: hypothetical protein QM817_30210 [Archangium sp.]